MEPSLSQRALCLFYILVLIAFSPKAKAAAFLDHKDGAPYVWEQGNTITYRVDGGPLGSISNADAKTMLADALNTWSVVPIASGLSFAIGTDLPDIDAANYTDYVTLDANGDLRGKTNDTVIIFDADGSIFDDLYGENASNSILGLASPAKLDESTVRITAGLAVINGKASASPVSLEGTITHEFGHMLNLAHTQLSKTEAENLSEPDDVYIPTMFPILPSDPSVLLSLSKDDEWSLAYLYPNAAALAGRGKITGKIKRRFSEGIRAVNVICRSTADPKGMAVSYISDQTLEGDGNYECGNLDAGTYTVEIEPIEVAINLYTPIPPFIVKEFYSGANESADAIKDEVSSKSNVTVTSSETTQNIDIILNETGRLFSGVSVTGQTDSILSSLDYFISVPAAAKSVRFELVGMDKSVDLDLLGRCDDEFSLTAGFTAPPFYSKEGDKQAEFAGVSDESSEVVHLSKDSDPEVSACTYHLVVLNNELSSSSAEFTLRATIDGKEPNLNTSIETRDVASATGEKVVAKIVLEALNDDFSVSGFTLSDIGKSDFARVQAAKIYVDENQDGEITTTDTLLKIFAQADLEDKTLAYSGTSLKVPEGKEVHLLVVYDLTEATTQASISWLMVILLISTLFMAKLRPGIALMVMGVFFLSCSSGRNASNSEFYPQISNKADLQAFSLAYGESFEFNGKGDKPTSVSDFFN